MSDTQAQTQGGAPSPSADIRNWDPEDNQFWENTGQHVAKRNLWISIPCLLLAFSVWMVWSVVVANAASAGGGGLE